MPMLICRQEFVVESFKCKESAKVKKKIKKMQQQVYTGFRGTDIFLLSCFHQYLDHVNLTNACHVLPRPIVLTIHLN